MCAARRVAVVDLPNSTGLLAYLRDVDWHAALPGCCVHTVEANSGSEAKKLAIREHRQCCIAHDADGEIDG